MRCKLLAIACPDHLQQATLKWSTGECEALVWGKAPESPKSYASQFGDGGVRPALRPVFGGSGLACIGDVFDNNILTPSAGQGILRLLASGMKTKTSKIGS